MSETLNRLGDYDAFLQPDEQEFEAGPMTEQEFADCLARAWDVLLRDNSRLIVERGYRAASGSAKNTKALLNALGDKR